MTVGARPKHLALGDGAAVPGSFDAIVEVVEQLGSEDIARNAGSATPASPSRASSPSSTGRGR